LRGGRGAGCNLGASGGCHLADVIKDMGALSKLDASDNGIFGKKDKAGITAWADALKANTSITELNLSKNKINADDAKILAPAISDNGAVSVISLRNNCLCNRESGKALSEMLAVNTVLKELDVSANTYYQRDSVGFAQELAVGISDNGTILHFTFSGDDDSQLITIKTAMAVADFSGKGLGTSGAIMLSAFLPKCT
jgi:hypothetical protein